MTSWKWRTCTKQDNVEKKKMTKVRKKQWVTGGDKKEQMKVKERKTGNDLHAESTLNEKELK